MCWKVGDLRVDPTCKKVRDDESHALVQALLRLLHSNTYATFTEPGMESSRVLDRRVIICHGQRGLDMANYFLSCPDSSAVELRGGPQLIGRRQMLSALVAMSRAGLR